MIQQQINQQTLSAFEALCFALSKLEWDYQKDSSCLQVVSTVWGDDIPMEIKVTVDGENQQVLLYSKIPFEVKENNEANIAIALSMINTNLEYGCFKYGLKQKEVYFQLVCRLDGCEMSVSAFEQVLAYAVKVIDNYNDKLLLLADELMTLDEFTVFLTELIEKEGKQEKEEIQSKDTENAESIFREVCNVAGLKTSDYTVDNDGLSVGFTVTGEDLPMDITVKVDKDNQIISITSPMPYKISVDNRVVCAVAVCAVADKLGSGNFDYDIINGIITFRVTAPFRDCVVAQEMIENMVVYASKKTDDYNDRFLALDKGFLKLDDFIDQ